MPTQPRLSVEWNALEEGGEGGRAAWNTCPVVGEVTIKNTVEAFKVQSTDPLISLILPHSASVGKVLTFLLPQSEDKALFLRKEGEKMWARVTSGEWLAKPDCLLRCGHCPVTRGHTLP